MTPLEAPCLPMPRNWAAPVVAAALLLLPGAGAFAQTFTVRGEYQNNELLGPDSGKAKDFFKDSARGEIRRQLIEMGFPDADAARASEDASVDLSGFGDEKVEVTGPDGKVKRTWKYRGQAVATYELTQSDMDRLLLRLAAWPVNTAADGKAIARCFTAIRKFTNRADLVDPHTGALRAAWSKILTTLIRQTENAAAPGTKEYLTALENTWKEITPYKEMFPGAVETAELEKEFERIAQLYLKSYQGGSAGVRDLLAAVDTVDKFTAPAARNLPVKMKDLIAFQWRGKISAMLSNSAIPIEETRAEVVAFIEIFGDRGAAASLLPRFRERWLKSVAAMKPANSKDLAAMTGSLLQFQASFPEEKNYGEAQPAVEAACKAILPREKPGDGESFRHYAAASEGCRAFVLDKAFKSKLEADYAAFARQAAGRMTDKSIDEALGDLAFLRPWIENAGQVKWGSGQAEFASGKTLQPLTGDNEPGEQCLCLSGAGDEACRAVQAGGARIELVGRFDGGKLWEVEICPFPHQNRSMALFQLFNRKAKIITPKHLADRFLSGDLGPVEDNGLEFSRPPAVLTLKIKGPNAGVAMASAAMRAAVEKKQKELAAKGDVEAKRKRADRLRQGWKTGACVKWDCEFGCQYEGKVIQRLEKKKAYKVGVLRAPNDPQRVGSTLELQEDGLLGCEE
ncbi:MAG: hypothetical protein GMKNLPBB_02571 [Myxococcota bacterium]|nr:hypothetical protein [Myxococcota bacterium]